MIDSEKKKTDLNNENVLFDRECSELAKLVEELENKIEFMSNEAVSLKNKQKHIIVQVHKALIKKQCLRTVFNIKT